MAFKKVVAEQLRSVASRDAKLQGQLVQRRVNKQSAKKKNGN
jgi:hypothetical protein